MEKVTIDKAQLDKMAEDIHLGINPQIYESARAMTELWANEGNDVNEMMMQHEYDNVFPACITFAR